jgi:hypothetical protein
MSQLSLNDSFYSEWIQKCLYYLSSNKTYLNIPLLFYCVFKVKMMSHHFIHIHKLSQCIGPDSIAEYVARPILTGYPTTLFARRPSPPTRDVSLSNNSFTLWQNCVEFISPGQPPTNGLVERFHRTLKAAIMCHADQQ